MRLWKDGHFQGQNISPKKRAGPGGFGLKSLVVKSIELFINVYFMAKEKKKTELEEVAEEAEEYALNYIMNIDTLNITVQEGGQVIFQSGSPPPLPPY